MPSFRAESSITTWLLAIARRVTAGLLADQRRNRQRSTSATFNPPPSQSSTASIEIELELDRLPARLREALMLTQVVGLTYEETAILAGVKVGTIRSRVFRARSALQQNLGNSAPGPDGGPERLGANRAHTRENGPTSTVAPLSAPALTNPYVKTPSELTR